MLKTLTGLALIALPTLSTQAQTWSDERVKIIVPYAAETRSAGSHAVALIDIGALTIDSDFTVFMRKDVPEDARRAMLRRLWVLMQLPVSCHELCYEPQAPPSGLAAGAEFKLLDPVKETKIGRIEKFVAAEAFRIGSRIGGRTLSAIGLNFTQHFLGVVETDVPAISLRGWTLLYTTGDKSLIKALGGEQEAAVPFLAYVHRLMEMGEEGAGHTDWRSNFAYMRSPIDGRLWAVHWSVNYADEWTIGAVYVPHPHFDWRSGSRLFGNPVTPADTRAAQPCAPGYASKILIHEADCRE